MKKKNCSYGKGKMTQRVLRKHGAELEPHQVIVIRYLIVAVQSLSPAWLFVTSWTAARQVSLFYTIAWSLLKNMSIELVILSSDLILCCPLLLLSSVFPSVKVFSSESALCITWPKYWSFSFNIIPSSEYSGLISFRIDCLDLKEV